MIRPTGDQVEYIDLSEPDSVGSCPGREDAKTRAIPGLLAGLEENDLQSDRIFPVTRRI